MSGGRTFGRVDLFDVVVRGGVFGVELDFARSVYSGDPVWLEIAVRAAGEGDYTTLDPRHRLAGEAISACVVDGDVTVNGRLLADPPAATPGLAVACCNDESSGGQLLLNGFLGGLALDDNEIQARTLGNPSPLTINGDGGAVGIGIATPQAPLHLPGSPDVQVGNGGVLVLGSPSGQNVAFDNNEIMSRSNGGASSLYINADGGTVFFGGPVDIGYQIATRTVADNLTTVSCPSGLRVLGGGCFTTDNITTPDHLIVSSPSGSTGWFCFYDDQSGNEITVYAICANVR
jgi:hypothetical protein